MLISFHRHRRIHEPRADGEVGEVGGYEEEDENDENEFGNVEEDSPRHDHTYLPSGLSHVTSMAHGGVALSMGGHMPGGMTMAAPSQLIQAQHLLQGQM